MNLPNYEFLSAPLWLVTILHLVTLTLHFAAMNFLFGGLIIVIHAGLRKRWDDPTLLKFVRLFPAAMAATVTLGVAPLLFLQMTFPRPVYAAAIVSGWFWLGVVGAVIVAYYALYWTALRGERTGKVCLSGLLLALAGVVYVSFVYSSVFSMAERPGLIQVLYAENQSGRVLNPAMGDYLLRWLHMVLGAVTVGGFFVGMLGRNEPVAYKTGKTYFVGGMALASVAGIAYLMSLQPILARLMQTRASWVLLVAILLSLGSLHFFFKKSFCVSGTMLLVSMLGMVYTRHIVRLLRLGDQFRPDAYRVAPQWGPFALFLVCFVVMLGVVAYMLRLFFGAKRAA
ncbi:MAG TPA: hypothetical protein VMV72_00405 [Verrucomicrobiae bacterium]|nr:hypothetical protein [Verrucomicrobiae bacterium]